MLAYGYSCTTWTSHILVGIWNIASVRDNAYDCDILSRDEEYEGLSGSVRSERVTYTGRVYRFLETCCILKSTSVVLEVRARSTRTLHTVCVHSGSSMNTRS
jgi:hypothetical protein